MLLWRVIDDISKGAENKKMFKVETTTNEVFLVGLRWMILWQSWQPDQQAGLKRVHTAGLAWASVTPISTTNTWPVAGKEIFKLQDPNKNYNLHCQLYLVNCKILCMFCNRINSSLAVIQMYPLTFWEKTQVNKPKCTWSPVQSVYMGTKYWSSWYK